jgi:hypothetical protein
MLGFDLFTWGVEAFLGPVRSGRTIEAAQTYYESTQNIPSCSVCCVSSRQVGNGTERICSISS